MIWRELTMIAALAVSVGGNAKKEIDQPPSASTVANGVPANNSVTAAEFTFEELWRVGGIHARPEAEFTGPFFVTAFGPAGQATILDYYQARVSIFDGRSGAFVRAFSRAGQGPGELDAPGAMTWDSPGRLWVANSHNGRYTVFDSTGQFIKTVRRPAHATTGRVFPMVVSADGVIIDHSSAGPNVNFLAVDSLGIVRDSLQVARPQTVDLGRFPIIPGTELGEAMAGIRGLRPSMLWCFARDGRSVWLARSDSLSFIHLSMDGDTLGHVRLSHRNGEFTRDQREAVRRIQRILDRDVEFVPILVQAIHAMDDGRLLVQIGNSWTEPGREFELLDAGGNWLGTVHAPFAAHHRSELASRGDTVLISAVGELDAPLLIKAVLKRVQRALVRR